jgi:hypothetical protein
MFRRDRDNPPLRQEVLSVVVSVVVIALVIAIPVMGAGRVLREKTGPGYLSWTLFSTLSKAGSILSVRLLGLCLYSF